MQGKEIEMGWISYTHMMNLHQRQKNAIEHKEVQKKNLFIHKLKWGPWLRRWRMFRWVQIKSLFMFF